MTSETIPGYRPSVQVNILFLLKDSINLARRGRGTFKITSLGFSCIVTIEVFFQIFCQEIMRHFATELK